jgi:hypothetical protein
LIVPIVRRAEWRVFFCRLTVIQEPTTRLIE